MPHVYLLLNLPGLARCSDTAHDLQFFVPETERFVANCVAVSETTLGLLPVILACFPAFAWTEVFVAGHKTKVEKFLRSPGRRKSGGAA